MNLDTYIAFGYCFMMLVLAILYNRYPPKKINSLYGYRTPRSMKNQTIWNAANAFSAHLLLMISLWSFLFPILALWIYPTFVILITFCGHLLLLGGSIFQTERYLTKHFDASGNPK